MKKTIPVLCAATLLAGAVFANPTGEITMKEKIICIPAEGKEEEIRGYHYFKLQESNGNLLLFCAYGGMNFIRKYLEFDASFHFPMEKVPEVVKTMTDAFYLCDLYVRLSYTIPLPDSEFTAGLDFNERSRVMDGYTLLQDGDKIWEDITLRWDAETDVKVTLEGTRVMPKSLAALIKGLRDFYNEWQKEHPEFERLQVSLK